MSANDIHGIEKGWTVKSHDGHSVGTVEETTDRYILVKDGLLNPSHHYIPAVDLAHVRPEQKEIGISLSKQAFEDGDWSEPPAEGPRRDVSIHQDDEDEDDDDPLTHTPRDPDRATTV